MPALSIPASILRDPLVNPTGKISAEFAAFVLYVKTGRATLDGRALPLQGRKRDEAVREIMGASNLEQARRLLARHLHMRGARDEEVWPFPPEETARIDTLIRALAEDLAQQADATAQRAAEEARGIRKRFLSDATT